MPFFDHIEMSGMEKYFLFQFMVLHRSDEVVRTNKELCTEFSMNDRRVSQVLRNLIKANILDARPILGRGRPKYAYSINNEHTTVLKSWTLVNHLDPVKLRGVIQQLTEALCDLGRAPDKGGIGPYLVLLVMLLRANSQGLVKALGFKNLSLECGLSEVSVRNAMQELLQTPFVHLVLRGGPGGFGLGRVKSIYQINLASLLGGESHSFDYFQLGSDFGLKLNEILKQLWVYLPAPEVRIASLKKTPSSNPGGLIQGLAVSLHDFGFPIMEFSRQLERFLNLDHQLMAFYQQLFEYIGLRLWSDGIGFRSFSNEKSAPAYLVIIDDFELAVLEKVFSELFEGMTTDSFNKLYMEQSDVRFLIFLSMAFIEGINRYQLSYPEMFNNEMVAIAQANSTKDSRVLIFSKSDK